MRAKTATVFLVVSFLFTGTLFAPKFKAAPARVTIKVIEGKNIEAMSLDAASIEIAESAKWNVKGAASDTPEAEFVAAEGKSLSFELLFDTFESGEDVSTKLPPLEKLTMVDETLQRPPMVTFTWGKSPAFKGVVESLNVKYTLFFEDGTPCRATVNLKMKQSERATTKTEPQPQPCD